MGPRQPRWVKSGKAPGKQHPTLGIQHSAKPAVATRRSGTAAGTTSGQTTKSAASTSNSATAADDGKTDRVEKRASSNSKLKTQNSKLLSPPKGYKPTAPERVKDILTRLDERYGDVTCALNHSSAWELLVATILSAQCTDARVNMVTPVLFKKYPTIEDFATLTPDELEPDIKSTGFFRNKSKSIVGAAKKVVNDFGGQVPEEMDQLLTLPGVARKTANVVLGSWFHKNEGVVVDTHVTRLSHRLELSKEAHPEKIERDLIKILPRERWTLFSHQLIWHGRKICVARSPKCVECPLENICHAADKTWSTVDIHKDAKP
jgi:endonuclease-3